MHLKIVCRQRSNIAMKCWCFLWIFTVFCHKISEGSSTSPPGNACGTLAQISEKLWEADERRHTFGDVESVFPDLTDFSDAAIADAIQMTSEESLPDIIVFLGAAKQGQNSGNSTKLFQFAKRKVFSDYHFDTVSDTFNPQPLEEEDAIGGGDKFYAIQEFLNSVVSTAVISELSNYLSCKGYEDTLYDMWDILFDLWFADYARYYTHCGHDSSGFEYTFVGEYTLEGNKVLGLHNWKNLYWLDRGDKMQYVSFNGLYEPNLLALSFTWDGREQSQGSVFLGTSPEFELAIYTLCFYEMVGQDCTLSLGGHEITLRTFQFDYDNKVGAAYPVIPSYTYSQGPSLSPNYSSNVDCHPTPPPGCDSLSEIAEKLWAADTNRLSFSDVATSSADIILEFSNASKLFQYVDESKLDSPLNEALLNVADNYDPEPGTDDVYWDHSEVDSFLDLLIATSPMTELADYLTCKGLLTDQTIKDKLWDLWFYEVYRNSGAGGADSSGFEYTFVGEYGLYDNVVGMHDWYRLYVLEKAGNLTYTGYIDLSEPNLLEVSFTWQGRVKNQGSVLLGSSIEFQMAAYTLCYMEMAGLECPLTMGGRVVTLMTGDGYGTIESAYPVSTSPTTTSATTTTSSTTQATTTTPPPSTTCNSLSDISEKLWTADTNRLSYSDVATSSSADIVLDFNTGTKLFQYVDVSKVDYPLYKALLNLTDNYDPQAYYDDYVVDPDESAEVESFLDLLMATRPMTELIDYLKCKGLVTDETDIKYWLWDLWFYEVYRYTEAWGADSSGFEYTFVGEFGPYDNDVVGLHDWYRLYVLERDGDLSYTGKLGLSEPSLLELSFTWADHVKSDGSVLLGSSVEFQMAVYTLCYMEMAGSECSLTMGGRVVTLMTVDRDGTIEAAYPVSASPITTTAAATSTTTTPTTPTTTATTSSTLTNTTATTTTSTTQATTTTTTRATTTTTTTTTPQPTTTTPRPTTTTTTTTTTSTTTTPSTTTTTPTTTTTTTTPTPVRRTSTTVKTPTTTSSSSFPPGGTVALLVLQLALNWLLQ